MTRARRIIEAQEHHYKLRYRPPSFASLPRGLKWDYAAVPSHDYDLQSRRSDLPTTPHRFGIIKTDRELTPKEMDDFEIDPA